MNNPHSEGQSQDYFSIKSTECKVDWSDLYKIKLIIRQPSPNWKDFGIDDIKIFTKTHLKKQKDSNHKNVIDSTTKTVGNITSIIKNNDLDQTLNPGGYYYIID